MLLEREGGAEEVPPVPHVAVVAERDAPRLEAEMALMRFLCMASIFPRDRCFVMVASLNVLAGGNSARVIVSCSVEFNIMFMPLNCLYLKSSDAD